MRCLYYTVNYVPYLNSCFMPVVVGLPVKTIEWITLPPDQMHKSSILPSYCHVHFSLCLPSILEINYHNQQELIDARGLHINTFAGHISKACFKKILCVEIMPCTGKNILAFCKDIPKLDFLCKKRFILIYFLNNSFFVHKPKFFILDS